jgi:hypothetical protein
MYSNGYTYCTWKSQNNPYQDWYSDRTSLTSKNLVRRRTKMLPKLKCSPHGIVVESTPLREHLIRSMRGSQEIRHACYSVQEVWCNSDSAPICEAASNAKWYTQWRLDVWRRLNMNRSEGSNPESCTRDARDTYVKSRWSKSIKIDWNRGKRQTVKPLEESRLAEI